MQAASVTSAEHLTVGGPLSVRQPSANVIGIQCLKHLCDVQATVYKCEPEGGISLLQAYADVNVSPLRPCVFSCQVSDASCSVPTYRRRLINRCPQREEDFFTVKWTSKLTDSSKTEALLLLGGNGRVLRVVNASSGTLEWVCGLSSPASHAHTLTHLSWIVYHPTRPVMPRPTSPDRPSTVCRGATRRMSCFMITTNR